MTRKSFQLQQTDNGNSATPESVDQEVLAFQTNTNNGRQIDVGDENQIINDESTQRGQWSKGIEFLLSCISMSVGLGNVWRFPYVAYENGGGAFLIPYLLLLFIIGRPMYYMELVLGQFSSRGPIKVWKIVPAFKGVGLAQLISTAYLIIFYNYLMALTLYYLFASFSNPLPWSVCDPEWAPNGNCNASCESSTTISTIQNISDDCKPTLWSQLYYERQVLRKSSGLEDINWISWKLSLCLIGSWTLVYLSVIKGVSSLGKVAYFTAIFPYTVLIALLIVALNTDGAVDGIIFFFQPKWKKLLDPIVWYRAVEQSFFSLAVCFGSLVMYSSYNGFNNNVYRDAIIISILDTLTSILAGCVIFSVLGTMAYESNKPIEDLATGGMGLAFVVYPEALSKIQVVPQLWSILFFIMLFTLGIGSSVAQIETILTSIKDEFTSLHRRKEILALVACSLFCLLGLPLVTDRILTDPTQRLTEANLEMYHFIYYNPFLSKKLLKLNKLYFYQKVVFIASLPTKLWILVYFKFQALFAGSYIMPLLDNYGVGTAVFFYGISQSVAVFWIYGLKRFCSDIKFMINQEVGIFWKITWGYTAPVALIVIFIYGNVELLINSDSHQKEGIPAWGTGIGWALAVFAVIQIPFWICFTIAKEEGSIRQKIRRAFSPAPDWGPVNPKNFEEWVNHNNKTSGIQSSVGYINNAFTIDNSKVVSAIKVDS